jgi:hypothetical protein
VTKLPFGDCAQHRWPPPKFFEVLIFKHAEDECSTPSLYATQQVTVPQWSGRHLRASEPQPSIAISLDGDDGFLDGNPHRRDFVSGNFAAQHTIAGLDPGDRRRHGCCCQGRPTCLGEPFRNRHSTAGMFAPAGLDGFFEELAGCRQARSRPLRLPVDA